MRAAVPRHRLVLGALAVLAGLAAGCGVSTEDHPEPIHPTEMPVAPTPTVTVVPDDAGQAPRVGPAPTTGRPAPSVAPTPGSVQSDVSPAPQEQVTSTPPPAG